ncbi:MAG: hypothetical protein ASARMPREDX12_002196 [Alectoria sarmentosa]|nr:MAG: hypothetical protein ASARMPREDX12_002196 [Alectoria sarmentosa]
MTASDDEDALLESLENDTENDPSLAHLREARIQQLASELKKSKQLRSEGFGSYDQIKDEKRLMEITTSTKCCVVHFYKPDFNRCRIMDGHLSALAPVHLSTRFLRIDVEHAPFLVTKLNVKVLPCVIAFIGGVSADRIVGFEGVRYSEDTFKTGDLEKRLVGAGVLEKEKGAGDARLGGVLNNHSEKKIIGGNGDGDDDDDWD